MQIEPCPFCGAEAQPRYDYFSGSSMKHHFIVCTKDANHRGGVGCYNTAPGQGNPSDSVGSCYKCQQDQTPCHFSIAAWNQRAERPSPAASEVERAVMVCPQCEGEGGYPDGMDEAACHTECTRCGSNGWIVDRTALYALFPSVSKERCEYCDGTGDVHRADGEWLGSCDCTQAAIAAMRPASGELAALADNLAALDEAATPAPWHASEYRGATGSQVWAGEPGPMTAILICGDGDADDNDAKLIVVLRNNLPPILAALRQAGEG